jgi:hypothetical protein
VQHVARSCAADVRYRLAQRSGEWAVAAAPFSSACALAHSVAGNAEFDGNEKTKKNGGTTGAHLTNPIATIVVGVAVTTVVARV